MRIVSRVRRRVFIGLTAVTGAVFLFLPLSAPARAGIAIGFEDVPDNSTFAVPISWLRTARITRGCNPPDDTRFYPH